jgi:hypothetical protein
MWLDHSMWLDHFPGADRAVVRARRCLAVVGSGSGHRTLYSKLLVLLGAGHAGEYATIGRHGIGGGWDALPCRYPPSQGHPIFL